MPSTVSRPRAAHLRWGLHGRVLALAAVVSVLMTQPIRELYQFGLAMAIGILLDTFLIRPLLAPGHGNGTTAASEPRSRAPERHHVLT